MAEPDEECGLRCQGFFHTVSHHSGVSFQPLPSDARHGDITGPELSPMCGHSPTPEDEMLSWRRWRSKTVMNDDNAGAALLLG